MEELLFTPCQIGPITLRNRSIRSAAFENMCYKNAPSSDLYNYHLKVSHGGIGMTTIAYASVNRSGISFPGQLWMRDEIVSDLKKLTEGIHAAGAKASIQLGHCGNMTHSSTAGQLPIGVSGGFNLYSPTFYRKLKIDEIYDLVKDFGNSVRLAKKAGFDAVEIHAGHGYLISQFLSPYTNKRKDEFGGSLRNRMLFMQLVIKETTNSENFYPFSLLHSICEIRCGALRILDKIRLLVTEEIKFWGDTLHANSFRKRENISDQICFDVPTLIIQSNLVFDKLF